MYSFNSHEGCLFIEIYLPKRSALQGALYDTLTKGFKVDNLRKYFETNQENISSFMGKGRTEFDYVAERALRDFLNRQDIINFIDKFPEVFKGYSMYEVDGVYKGERGIIEEITQVIRIFFRPQYQKIYKDFDIAAKYEDDIKCLIKDFLRSPTSEASSYLTKYFDESKWKDGNKWKIERETLEAIINHMGDWVIYVLLFVYGYVINNICQKIENLCKKDEIAFEDAEEEIWVSSFWNLVINRITLKSNMLEEK